MKSQVTPIIPVAALVVATLAAGATMWHRLLVDASTARAPGGAMAVPKADTDASTRKAASDARRGDAAHQPMNVVTPAPK